MALSCCNRVYLGSTCVAMITTFVLVCLAVLFHPQRSSDIELLTRLKEEVSCSQCYANFNQYQGRQPHCTGCDFLASFRATPGDPADTGNMLSLPQRQTIREVVRKKLQSVYHERIDEAFEKFKDSHDQILNQTLTLRERTPVPVVQCSNNYYAAGKPHERCHHKELTETEKELFPEFSQQQKIPTTVYLYRSKKFSVSGWYDIHFEVKVPHRFFPPQGNFSALLTTWRKGTGSQAAKLIQRADKHAANIDQTSSLTVLSGHAVDKIFADDHLELLIHKPTHFNLEKSIYVSALFLRDAE